MNNKKNYTKVKICPVCGRRFCGFQLGFRSHVKRCAKRLIHENINNPYTFV